VKPDETLKKDKNYDRLKIMGKAEKIQGMCNVYCVCVKKSRKGGAEKIVRRASAPGPLLSRLCMWQCGYDI